MKKRIKEFSISKILEHLQSVYVEVHASLVTNIHESLAQSPFASEDQRLQLSLYLSTLPFIYQQYPLQVSPNFFSLE